MSRSSRESTFELLRVVSMFGIVLSHFATHGIWENVSFENAVAVDCLSLLGPLSVDVFILITGYFSVCIGFRSKSLIKVIFQTLFWCAVIDVVALLILDHKPAVAQLVSVPWFVTAYCAMYLFIPWMNYLAKTIQQRSYLLLLSLGFLILSVLTSFSGTDFFFSNLTWFCWVYMLGGYIRLHAREVKTVHYAMYLIAGCIAMTIIVAVLKDAGLSELTSPNGMLSSRNSPNIAILAIIAFLLFRSIHLGKIPLINAAGEVAFGVYLISDNSIVRGQLWHNFSAFGQLPLPSFLVCGLLVCIGVFVISALLERARILLFNRIKLFFPDATKDDISTGLDEFLNKVAKEDE